MKKCIQINILRNLGNNMSTFWTLWATPLYGWYSCKWTEAFVTSIMGHNTITDLKYTTHTDSNWDVYNTYTTLLSGEWGEIRVQHPSTAGAIYYCTFCHAMCPRCPQGHSLGQTLLSKYNKIDTVCNMR